MFFFFLPLPKRTESREDRRKGKKRRGSKFAQVKQREKKKQRERERKKGEREKEMVGSGASDRSKEAVGMMALHEALRSVCLNSDWTYSVFWTIRPRPYFSLSLSFFNFYVFLSVCSFSYFVLSCFLK